MRKVAITCDFQCEMSRYTLLVLETTIRPRGCRLQNQRFAKSRKFLLTVRIVDHAGDVFRVAEVVDGNERGRVEGGGVGS